jgi:crotonobetainyl-CoA:carnitine CoA-transferase CaiB-like acyl-CoA transferase
VASQNPDEVITDLQLLATGGLLSVGQVDAFRAVAPPTTFAGTPIEQVGAVPDLGQHTTEVLEPLGVSPARLAELREQGLIAG